jgi:hypothetical protein
MTTRARSSLTLFAALAAALFAATARAPVAASQPAPAPSKDGVEHFLAVARVLQSPRCMNCHPVGDAPLQTDASIPHAMNVSRKSNDAGLACTACHRATNNPFLHGPPGVPNWRLPPAATPMVFEKKTPAEICAQIKNPAKNGGKTLDQLVEHMAHDPLVLWGWAPGPGRTLPPIPHAEFAAHAKAWVAAGAPCPP